MVAKRKTLSAINKKINSRSSNAASNAKVLEPEPEHEEEEVVSDSEMQIVAVEEASPEMKEKEIVEQRTKELKSLSVSFLKELISSKDLTTGKKDDMIKALLKFEAKERVEARDHEATIRAVVTTKKEELESTPVAELSKLCEGVKGVRSKQERITHLLQIWLQADGVDKALAKIAQDARRENLAEMDTATLRKLCEKVGVDPFVQEIMVERISKLEKDAGRYEKPELGTKPAECVEKKTDMVEALLENEKNRKKEKELRQKQDEAVANKRKELKAMSVDDLKVVLKKKGLEPEGKKEDLIEILFVVGVQEEAARARKAEFKAMGLQDLKQLVSSKGLEPSNKKEEMVEAMLQYEAKCLNDLEAFKVKGAEVLAQKREELAAKTNTELKEMCASSKLAVGGGKDERVERLLEEVANSGSVDKLVATLVRKSRKEELSGFDKPTLLELCEATGADPFVKDIMIERILVHESEFGESVEPAAKRARTSKK